MAKFVYNYNKDNAINTDKIKFIRCYQTKDNTGWLVYGHFSDDDGISFGKFNTEKEAKNWFFKIISELNK